ncbi:MAG: glycosyltransferase [Filimonas sp.]|nr:glycosyltransferase [Filimonas sp.]
MNTKKFAGFIMTYNRNDILCNMIETLFKQTYAPQKLLIIDCASNDATKQLIEAKNDARLQYYDMQYNAGPAGASRKGLQLLAEQGYDFIYWGDDDDPPFFEDTFERLMRIYEQEDGVGCVGSVGHTLNKRNGSLVRMETSAIKSTRYLPVDTIGGGMSMIIKTEVILKNILPDDKLFFGFEELDFHLSMQRHGYKIVVDSALFLQLREKFNRLEKSPFKRRKIDKHKLKREYYSLRNLLYIYKKNKLRRAALALFIRKTGKTVTSFKYGLGYGVTSAKFYCLAIFHFVIGKMNQ